MARSQSVPSEILHGLLVDGSAPDLGELATRTGCARSSIREWLGAPNARPGLMRQARLVDLHPDRGYEPGPGLGLVLAFSVGGEHLVGALVDAAGHARLVVRETPVPRQLTAPPTEFLRRLRDLGESVLRRALSTEELTCPSAEGAQALRLIGATVAWPAPMSHDTTPARGAPLHGDWHRQTFREHLHDALGLPLERCHALNDANAGALTLAAEQQPARPGPIICLHVSAGIGVGTVHQAIPRPSRSAFIDAHLVGGRDGTAGEIGHCVLDPHIVQAWNARSRKRGRPPGPWEDMPKLDPNRRCDCDPDARGHLEAVLGAEAVLQRLGRYAPGDSLVERVRELHADASHPFVRLALRDVGRGIASVMAGAVASTDPVQLTVVGALAHEHVVTGMNEQFEAYNVAERAALYDRPDRELIGLRGAAFAVLRGALYRGFFDHASHKPSGDAPEGLPEAWTGWDIAPAGVQSGQTARAGSAWTYKPIVIDERSVDRFAAGSGLAGSGSPGVLVGAA